ncbi:hypothetical protein CDV36_015958 [Fusarium kuroshium]|uniref:Uncharacterized protein n=1 Tax=Fusarium kuroshium TaxID=2010991 RepID=A0A3M2R3D0_9HYPO|nr:hypothetical protein CDV36_015958 [Fusarium kuroshium]
MGLQNDVIVPDMTLSDIPEGPFVTSSEITIEDELEEPSSPKTKDTAPECQESQSPNNSNLYIDNNEITRIHNSFPPLELLLLEDRVVSLSKRYKVTHHRQPRTEWHMTGSWARSLGHSLDCIRGEFRTLFGLIYSLFPDDDPADDTLLFFLKEMDTEHGLEIQAIEAQLQGFCE